MGAVQQCCESKPSLAIVTVTEPTYDPTGGPCPSTDEKVPPLAIQEHGCSYPDAHTDNGGGQPSSERCSGKPVVENGFTDIPIQDHNQDQWHDAHKSHEHEQESADAGSTVTPCDQSQIQTVVDFTQTPSIQTVTKDADRAQEAAEETMCKPNDERLEGFAPGTRRVAREPVPTKDDIRVFDTKPSGGNLLDLKVLDGSWVDISSENKLSVGVMKDGVMNWDRHHFGTVSSEIRPLGVDTVRLLLDGEESVGVLSVGPPACLTWDDGATWSRVEQPQEDTPLMGVWVDSGNPQPICTIVGNSIHWNDKVFGSTQASVDIEVQADASYGMTLNGELCTAKLTIGPPAMLSWNDGASWTRDELQGVWMLVGQDTVAERIGTVTDGQMHWDARFCHPPTTLTPACPLPFATIAMTMDGEQSTAVYDPGPPARLSWVDGEVWMRAHMC